MSLLLSSSLRNSMFNLLVRQLYFARMLQENKGPGLKAPAPSVKADQQL
jgi:hypothetical protein